MSTMHLRPVDRPVDRNVENEEITALPAIPDFEGQPVDLTRAKLAAASRLELGEGDWHRIDDTVRMFVEGTITRVDHVVDRASGKLVRVHTITVTDAVPLPWGFDMDRTAERPAG